MSTGSTPSATNALINDPAIQARARAEYQKRLATDASLQNKSETQAINEIAAKYVADEAARDPNFAISFNKGALGDLEDLGDVTAAEEHDATAILRAGESVKPELPAGQDDKAMQQAQQADTKALTDAQAALASLQKQGLPKEVIDQYAAQVATLEKQVKQKWSGQPKPEAERNQDLVKQAYQDVFGREPDVGGEKYHLERVEKMRAAGMDDKAIAARLKQDFEHSEEYRLAHGLPADANKGYQQWQAPKQAAGSTPAPSGSSSPPPTTSWKDNKAEQPPVAKDPQLESLQHAANKIAGTAVPENDAQAVAQQKHDQAILAQARAAMEATIDAHGDVATAKKLYQVAQAAYDRKWNAQPQVPPDVVPPAKRGQAF